MHELVYARSPSPGRIEIVVAKNHTAEAYELDEFEIAALWGALSEAIRHNYVDSLSPPRKTGTRGMEANGRPDRDASRGLGHLHCEEVDKSKRKYGVRK